jgi:hypothetical protein
MKLNGSALAGATPVLTTTEDALLALVLVRLWYVFVWSGVVRLSTT